MKKKLLIILTSSLLTLNMVSVASFATTKQIYIDDLDQLKSVLQQDTAIEDINNNVAPAVATEFMEEKMDQAAEIINGEAFTVNMQRQVDGSLYGKLSFNLGDGCELIVELSDKSEAQEHFDISRAAVSTSDSQWLGYGKRQFMAKTSVKCPVGTVYMNLTNRYTLSADGIDERSGAATCSWSNLGGIITHISKRTWQIFVVL